MRCRTVIADGSITTAKLDDDAVTYAKLGTEFTTSGTILLQQM